MHKIKKSKQQKKQQRNQIIMAVFLSVIMLASMLGIMLNQEDNTIKYNKYKFTPLQNGYSSKMNGEIVYFNYLPSEVSNLEIPENFCLDLKNSAAIKILFEPDNSAVQIIDYIRLEFQEKLDQTIVSAVTESSAQYSVLPVSNCSESSELQPTIFFKQGNVTKLSIENDNCLIAESSDQGFVMLKDRLMYCYYGVLE